ncbi:MAG: 3-oxoacyl-[acyl-carrier-protein] reductase FabG [Chlamydiia bacterium]|nr:3-oxoacyl-[acyl-carrier-protein] reductase FabG [Chlamydiia bacterium]
MDYDLQGKRVLVLGSSSGLGFATAKAYANEGATVAICSSNKERIENAASQIKNSHPFVSDLTKEGAGAALVWQVIEKLGGIDILITNTGNPPHGLFMESKPEEWRKAYESLYMSVVESTMEAVHGMKEQKFGRIILITSVAAKEPLSSLTISSSLRAGLLGLMKTLSIELAKDGITVNSILPGFTNTEATKRRFDKNRKEIEATIPAGRFGEPEEFASLAVYLGSKGAAFVNGQAIACDGGSIKGL